MFSNHWHFILESSGFYLATINMKMSVVQQLLQNTNSSYDCEVYNYRKINREIFVVKIFSWVGSTTKIKHENFSTTKICKHMYAELRVVCCKFMLKSLAAAETLSAWSYCLASDN